MIESAAITVAIAQLLATIFDLGSYDRLPLNIQNRLNNYAAKLAQEWAEKQQQSDYSGNSVVSSVPNRSQLESMLYRDNANDTHKFMRDLEIARQKDSEYYNKNKVWFSLGKVFGTAIDTSNNLFNMYAKGIMPSEWADKIKPKSFNKWLDKEATYYTRAQASKWKDVQAKNQDRVNKFSHYVAQSHDRFKRSTPQDAQNTQNTRNNINEYRKERQV